MAGRTGTHDITFLLQSTNPITNGNLTFQEVVDALDADVNAYNTIMRDQLDALVTVRAGVAGRIGVYGGSASGSMTEVDEYGRAPTQRAAAVAQVAFPFKKYQYPVGWTKEWEKRRSAADFARAVQGAQIGHRQRVSAEIKKALYLSSNFTFRDHLVDNVDLAVKRLVNADGATIPNGPNGETFDGSTHTHYLANATLTTAAVDSAISTVIEHGHGSSLRIYIAQTNETAFRALTGFVAYVDPRLMLGTQANQPAQRLDITAQNNRVAKDWSAFHRVRHRFPTLVLHVRAPRFVTFVVLASLGGVRDFRPADLCRLLVRKLVLRLGCQVAVFGDFAPVRVMPPAIRRQVFPAGDGLVELHDFARVKRPLAFLGRAPRLFVRIDEDDALDGRRVLLFVSHVHAYGLEMVGSVYVPLLNCNTAPFVRVRTPSPKYDS